MPRQATQTIKSIENFIEAVRADTTSWNPKEPKWFRGEPRSPTPLLPTLYREDLAAFENPLLQMFRSRASGYHDVVPDVERTDQWLFLARHAGLPTRLLDWTEGALIGLHFALQEQEQEPVVWMLNPLELNELAGVSQSAGQMREFPLTWVDPCRRKSCVRKYWRCVGTGQTRCRTPRRRVSTLHSCQAPRSALVLHCSREAKAGARHFSA
jgi:hypothetical protein